MSNDPQTSTLHPVSGVPQGPSPRRIFLGWDAPALPRAAKEMARTYASEGGEAGVRGMDARIAVVVTPGARAGRRLGELLLEEAEASFLPLTPPRMVTLGRFPELLYSATKPLADSTQSRYAFARALKGMSPGMLEAVFPRLPESVSGWMALAGIVQKLHEEVGREGMSFHDVAQAFRLGFPYDDSPRWEILARVQDEYLQVLASVGLGDRDRERVRALREERLTPPGEVWLMGVVELPRVVREMLGRLPGSVRSLIHAPEEIHDRFDPFGCVIPGAWETAVILLEDEQVRVVQRPPDQADAVSDILRGFRGRFGAEEMVVGVPDQELVPYVERGLSSVEAPHRFAGGTPLMETGPARLLEVLAEYLRDRSAPAFGALIRHPDLHPILEEFRFRGGEPPSQEGGGNGSLTVADNYQKEHLQARLQLPLPGKSKWAAPMRRLVAHLEEALVLETLSGRDFLTGWMDRILEILVRVYGSQPLDLGKRGVRQMVEALTLIKGAASSLATLPETLAGEVEGWDAVSLLLSEISGPEKKIPPDPGDHAIELLGWLELPLDDAPAVVLCGVNERNIPEAVGADPFLPGALRSHLGLSDDQARFGRDAYLLSALISSRVEAHLVAGRLSATGDPLMPSRLLFAAPPQQVAARIRRFLDDGGVEEDGDASPPGGGLRNGVSSRVPDFEKPSFPSRFVSPPVDPIVRTETLRSIRVTDFSTFLKDPYRYALRRVLGLDPLDDEGREMSGGTFGTLAHEVLERFGRSQASGITDPGEVEKKLLLLLDHVVRETFGSRPFPAVRVQVEQLRVRLRYFAEWQAAWAEEGWEVVCVEQQPQPGYPFDVDGETVLLRGKIDRIDHNPRTGQWAVFDYKTGDDGKDPEKSHRKGRAGQKEWQDLQLPLYRLLLTEVMGEDGAPVIPAREREKVSLGYILLPKAVGAVGAALAEWTEEELTEAEEAAREVVRKIRTGVFPFDPGYRSGWEDPYEALLGLRELPRAPGHKDGGET